MRSGSLTTSGEVTILKVPQRERERPLAQPASSLVSVGRGEWLDKNCLLTMQFIGRQPHVRTHACAYKRNFHWRDEHEPHCVFPERSLYLDGLSSNGPMNCCSHLMLSMITSSGSGQCSEPYQMTCRGFAGYILIAGGILNVRVLISDCILEQEWSRCCVAHIVNGFNRPHSVNRGFVLFEELIHCHHGTRQVTLVGNPPAITHNQHTRF